MLASSSEDVWPCLESQFALEKLSAMELLHDSEAITSARCWRRHQTAEHMSFEVQHNWCLVVHMPVAVSGTAYPPISLHDAFFGAGANVCIVSHLVWLQHLQEHLAQRAGAG